MIANLPCQSDFRLTMERHLFMCMMVFPEWFNWERRIHPKNGWCFPWTGVQDWIKRRRWDTYYHSCLCASCLHVWPACLILQSPCGLYLETVSWNKLWLLSVTLLQQLENSLMHIVTENCIALWYPHWLLGQEVSWPGCELESQGHFYCLTDFLLLSEVFESKDKAFSHV